MSSRPQPPHVRQWRDVLNTHWPTRPATFAERAPILVTARIVWQGDGEEFVPGEATRWDNEHVYVRIDDRRCQGAGVWLKPADVYRRLPD